MVKVFFRVFFVFCEIKYRVLLLIDIFFIWIIFFSFLYMFFIEIFLKLNFWYLDKMVVGIFWIFVVVRIKSVWEGGFLRVFKSVLKVLVESMWILFIIYIFFLYIEGGYLILFLICFMLLIFVFDAVLIFKMLSVFLFKIFL